MSRSPRDRAGVLPAPQRDWAYFLDIDGTLVDLADTPATVRLAPQSHRLVAALHHASGGALALISGRAIADIDRLFPEVRLPAAGQHGVERRNAAGGISHHAFSSKRLDRVRARLAPAAARHAGLLLEDKGLSLALHYRAAPRLAGHAHRLMRSLLKLAGPGYCVLEGKRVIEIKPAGRDKGTAVLEFMREEPFRGRVPVFLGDDITDEYGFAVVNRLHGHSIKVGPGPTVARWNVPTVRHVLAWLDRGGTVAR